MAASSAACESESVLEAEDFYPYGATRIDTKTNYGGEKRKYAGTEYDALSGLNYAMARYQNPTRGQFISEDPVFLGDPSLQNLADPQSLNSYSYANGNPITKSDPSGRWALQLGGQYTIPGWFVSGGAGISIDQNGIDYYYGGGLAGGGGGQITAQITTANLDHQYSVSTGAFVAGGFPVGAEVSGGMTYYPYSLRKPEPYIQAGGGLAAEASAGVMNQISGPLLVWNRSQNKTADLGLSSPKIVSSISRYTPTIMTAGQTNASLNNIPPRAAVGSGGSQNIGQVLGQLQTALRQLDSLLSTYKSTNR